jgi:hypothetical protein
VVTVTNIRGSALIVDATGAVAGVFGGTSDCNHTVLAPGASCHLYYQFTPTSVGFVSGTTSGTFNDRPLRTVVHRHWRVPVVARSSSLLKETRAAGPGVPTPCLLVALSAHSSC